MTAADAPHIQHRVLAVIAPGDGPHLLWPPVTAGPGAGSRSPTSLLMLRAVNEEPARFEVAAAAWHARWCINLPTLTLAEDQTRSPRFRRSPDPQAPTPPRSCGISASSTASAARQSCSSAGWPGESAARRRRAERQRRPRRRTSPSTAALLCVGVARREDQA